MPTTRFSGIVSAAWQDAGGNYTSLTDLGELHEESTLEYELPEEDLNTTGQALYAGEFKQATIRSFDLSKHAALLTKYKADERIDVRLTLQEGDTIDIEGVLPRVFFDTVQGGAGRRNTFSLVVRAFTV